jgi:hypothetical protein
VFAGDGCEEVEEGGLVEGAFDGGLVEPVGGGFVGEEGVEFADPVGLWAGFLAFPGGDGAWCCSELFGELCLGPAASCACVA